MRVISGSARGTKLESLEDVATRPTLDRVKEALFNIIQFKLPEAVVLDLFAGSGAIGIECLSRGAKQVVLCDKSHKAIQFIKQNITRTRFQEKAVILQKDYETCLRDLKKQQYQFDFIYLDPPYDSDFAIHAVEQIIQSELITKDTIMVIETDEKEKIMDRLNEIQIEVYDVRKYGRVKLIFLRRKG